MIKTNNYHKTNEYKLKKVGYNSEEITKIEKLNNENIDYIINNEYNENLKDILSEKYYIDKNMQRYIDYQKQNPNEKIRTVISIVNVNADHEYYKDTKATDIEKKELMLVNKYNYLDETYSQENINPISSRYAYEGNFAPDEVMEYYKKMHQAAEKENIELIISSAYRSYKEQEETYEYYKQ